MRILDWTKKRRTADRRSFSTSLESGDRGLYFHAVIRYRWRLNPESSAPQPLAPTSLVQHLLRERIAGVLCNYRILDKSAAKNAANSLLDRELVDDEHRVIIEGRVQLRIPRPAKSVALMRAAEETDLRTAYARETVELELLLDRLTDSSLGPVWWVSRYADLQFASGDADKKIRSTLAAFSELQKTLDTARINQTKDQRVFLRRKIDEVFSVIEDEQSLSLALQVMNRTLEHIGLHHGENNQENFKR